jgi:hypothetical protein
MLQTLSGFKKKILEKTGRSPDVRNSQPQLVASSQNSPRASESANLPTTEALASHEGQRHAPPETEALSDPKELNRSNELKETAIGALKIFLELGAIASQALPIGMVKVVFDYSSYIVRMVEVRLGDFV